MNDLSTRLAHLGDTLERAAAADLSATTTAITAAPRSHRARRRLVMLIAAVGVGAPTAAVAATHLFASTDVAKSMPAGTLALAGTEPSCTIVKNDVEYHCVLAHAPAPEVSDWSGTVEPTVDATKHVNGGCRSVTPDGREWECYLGAAAVDQQIIGADLLGQSAPTPGRG
jgi:hypothetical protein